MRHLSRLFPSVLRCCHRSFVALHYRALQLGNASVVAPIDKLSVAFAILLGVVVLGEPLTWQLALGGALIIAGALVIAIA